MKQTFSPSCCFMLLSCFLLLEVLLLTMQATEAQPSGRPPGPEPGWTPRPPATGGGVYGANRPVEAPTGYVSVKGTFADPVFDLKPTKGKKGTSWSNKLINRPTFYFGIKSGRTTTDAGLQWETDPGTGRNPVGPGWVVFHRVTITTPQGSWQLWKNTPAGDRVPHQGVGNTVMRYEVQPDGRVMLYTRSGKWGPHNWGPYTSLLPTAHGKVKTGSIVIRRNVGLTQAEADKTVGVGGTRIVFDGSVVRNLSFVGGRISRKAGMNLPDSAFADWTRGAASMKPPAKKKPKASAKAPWVIDFEPPSTPRSQKAPNPPTGYRSERVVINLGDKRVGRGKQ